MRQYTQPIAFRVTAGDHRRLNALAATFTEPKVSIALRWLLEQPETRALIDERLATEATPQRGWGLEAGLPTADR
jgi:hypothetical protein